MRHKMPCIIIAHYCTQTRAFGVTITYYQKTTTKTMHRHTNSMRSKSEYKFNGHAHRFKVANGPERTMYASTKNENNTTNKLQREDSAMQRTAISAFICLCVHLDESKRIKNKPESIHFATIMMMTMICAHHKWCRCNVYVLFHDIRKCVSFKCEAKSNG